MKGLAFVLAALAVFGLGFWAYHQNYRTKDAMAHVQDLHDRIGAAHARLRVLKAEWAYLNRPDRLADLAGLNFDRLGLLPMSPDSFGRVEQVLTAPEPIQPLTGTLIDPVDIAFEAEPGVEPL